MKKKSKRSVIKKARESYNSNIAANIIIGIIVMLLVFGVIAQMLGYVQFSDEFTKEYTDNAMRISKAAANYINADNLDKYLEESGDMNEYRAVRAELQNLCDKVNAMFIYVIRPDEDYEHITFIFNIVNKDSDFEPYDIGYVRDTTNDDYKLKYSLLYDGLSHEEYVVRDKGFIESDSHITAMVPLKNKYGDVVGILCTQRQMKALSDARRNYIIKMLIVVIALIIATTLIYELFLDRSVIKPLRSITAETKRFAADQRSPDIALTDNIKSDNEIGQLAEAVDKMESETLSYIENLTRVTAETERIGTELAVASAIQQGMLDSVAPDISELSIHAVMAPAKEVGGDFYDYFMIDDDHLCMVIADVSGKGVPAALFMAISKLLISDTTLLYSSPAEILGAVNERICRSNKLDMFVTVWLGILEISTGRITAANAGHEYPAVCRKDSGFELMKDKHGFVVGGMSGVRYKDYDFTLAPGDALFLYTDGVTEAADSSLQLFGSDRMLAALNSEPHAAPDKIIANIQSAVDEFVSGAPQFDDLTMMCLRYYGKDHGDR